MLEMIDERRRGFQHRPFGQKHLQMRVPSTLVLRRPSDHGGRLDATPDDGIAQEGRLDAGSLDDSSTPQWEPDALKQSRRRDD